jgi:general stress protein 26
MPTPQEIQTRFWKALKSDRTLMLGIDGVGDGHAQPMTGQTLDGAEHGPIWFFTTKDNTLVKEMREGTRATAHLASKNHEVFASIHGNLVMEQDRAMIDRLWNRFAAAWYEGGKDDPQLAHPAGCRARQDLAGRVEPVRRDQDPAGDRSQGGLCRQGRRRNPQLTPAARPAAAPPPFHAQGVRRCRRSRPATVPSCM